MTGEAIYNDYGEDYNDAYVDLATLVRPVVDSAVACIIGRELIEAIMFITSHVGAVTKHPTLSQEEKTYYLKRLIPAIAGGFFFGLLVTLAVAIPLAAQADKLISARAGVEIGEGVSKTIAFFFVLDLTFRIPKWFGISRYVEPDTAADGAVVAASDGEAPETTGKEPTARLASAWTLALSLLWNTSREAAEGGILTAVTVILTQSPPNIIGASVATGIAAAGVLGMTFYFGAKYISVLAFGVAAAVLSQLLAMGLATGAVREFEEAYATNNGGQTSGVIYDVGGTTGYGLTSLEFMGWSGSLTALTLSTWLISLTILTAVQIWHNVLGRPLVPERVKNGVKKWVDGVKKRCEKRGEEIN